MTISGRIAMLLWNADKFSLSLMFKKKEKKIIYFYFYLMFPNIKKSRFLHQLSQTRPCKAIWSVYSNHPPSVLLLYTTVINTGKLNGMCLVGKFHPFTKKTKTNNMQDRCYFVSAKSIYKLVILFRRHMGLKILAVQFYPTTPQKAQMTVPTLIFAGLR